MMLTTGVRTADLKSLSFTWRMPELTSSQPVVSSASTNFGMCNIHEKPWILYCRDCKQALCATCLTDCRHLKHGYETLEKGCKLEIERVTKQVKKLKSSLEKQTNIKAQVTKAKKDLEDTFNLAKETIIEHYRELQELIDQNMQQAFQLIQAQRDSTIQAMDQLLLDGEEQQQKSKQILETVEQLKKRENTDFAVTLSEINTLEIKIEGVEDYYRNIVEVTDFDKKRLKALEESIAKIVQRNKEMLPKPWEFGENVAFDDKTSHGSLKIFGNKTKVQHASSKFPHKKHSMKQEETWANILASQSFTEGRHYWEVRVKDTESWTVGVVEKGWVKKGIQQALGQDKLSWALQMDGDSLAALHNDETIMIREGEIEQLGVFLDFKKGRLQFYNVHSGSVLHTFGAKFKNVYPAFSIDAQNGKVSQMRLCPLMPLGLVLGHQRFHRSLLNHHPPIPAGIHRPAMSMPAAPPSYAEAVAGDKEQGFGAPPYSTQPPPVPPSSVPIHPSWAYVHPSPSPGYTNPYASDMSSPFSDPSTSGSCDGLSADGWEDRNIRRMFIRKVFTILMIQLMVTFAIVALFTFCDEVRQFVQYNRLLYLASYITFMGTYLVLVCSTSTRRQYPTNLILLGIFTLAMSYMAGMLASYHNTKVVMLCVGITAAVCLAVTLFCFQTKFDFTSCHGLMFSLMMVLMVTGLLLVFTAPFGYIPWVQTAYAGLGALVFTLFLAFDVQVLMGTGRYSLSPEEHVFGAICLYMDIVYIFFFLLQLFGSQE
ncbi:hypothetical protein AGOR_G00177280 [Albula goreensis]|uniref:Uncharacterized protein n=1 Tax=Albula goreensis TaxID=1534307 RepID=A0A8T3D0M7_9TELE|nr:hypothetical protein AGOR_G00177280 [Albula goreensis]